MSDARTDLPAVHKLLDDAERHGLIETAPRDLVVSAIRETLDTARSNNGTPPEDGWLAGVRRALEIKQRPSLVPVINATGVVLHTNLGRAPLHRLPVHLVRVPEVVVEVSVPILNYHPPTIRAAAVHDLGVAGSLIVGIGPIETGVRPPERRSVVASDSRQEVQVPPRWY